MKKNKLLSLVLCFMFLLTAGIANAITLSERDELNKATPGTDKVGLGTIMRSQLATGVIILFTGDTSAAASQTIKLSVEPSGDTGYVRKFTSALGGDSSPLADGRPGQILQITLVSDGGTNYIVTPDTSSGWRSITFADAGDVATFKFIDTTVGWIVLGTADVTSGPVLTAPSQANGFK